MPLSSSEKSALQASVAQLSADINALVEDPVPNPLQVALDAANAQIATLTTQLNTANSTISTLTSQLASATAATNALQAKIDAAKVQMQAADTADAAEDSARAAALAALG